MYVSGNAQIPGTGTFINLPGFYDNEPGLTGACRLAVRGMNTSQID